MKKKEAFLGMSVGLGIVAIFVFVLALIFLSVVPENSEDLSVRLGWLHQAQYTGMYVAEDKGYYQDVNLQVDLQEFEFNVDQIDELVRGDVDFSIMSAAEHLSAIDAGHDLIAIAAIYQISPYAFITLADSGIMSPLDFPGKRLGDKGGNEESRIVYTALLSRFNIDTAEAEFTSLDFSLLEWEDLVEGRADVVDIFRTDQVYIFQQENIDYHIIKPEDYGFVAYEDVIVTRRSFAQENSETVSNFIQATVEGWSYALDNQEEAVDIVMNYAQGSYLDRDYELFILEHSEELIRTQANRNIGEMNFIPWNKAYQQMIANNLIQNPFNVTDVYTNVFLD